MNQTEALKLVDDLLEAIAAVTEPEPEPPKPKRWLLRFKVDGDFTYAIEAATKEEAIAKSERLSPTDDMLLGTNEESDLGYELAGIEEEN